MFNCAICGENFRTESDLESHEETTCAVCGGHFRTKSDLVSDEETVWCDECQEEWDCKSHNLPYWCDECGLKFGCDSKHEKHMQQRHQLECDIYRRAKMSFETLKNSTVKENGDEHEAKNDEVPADGKYNVDETLIKNRKGVTEKEGAFDNNLENAYGTNNVQTDVTGSCCEKCGITFTSKEDFRRHQIKSYETNAYDIIYICLYMLIFVVYPYTKHVISCVVYWQ